VLASGILGPVVCEGLGHLGVKKGVVDDPQFGPVLTWFDPSTIGQVTVGQLSANNQSGIFGNLDKNPLTGPGHNNWDLALMRNIKLPWHDSGSSLLQFRVENFNALNHPQCSGVNPFLQRSDGTRRTV